MADVVNIGNVTVDILVKPEKDLPKWGRLCLVENPIVQSLGGNGAIFSAYLTGLGRKNAFYGRIGDDARGDWVLADIETRKLGREGILRTNGVPTDTTVILVDEQGRRAFLHHQGAGATTKVDDVPQSALDSASWLHISSYLLLPGITGAPMVKLLKKAKTGGLFTSLDIAWDPTGKWEVQEVAKHLDVLFLNIDEGEQITKSDAPLEILEMVGSTGPKVTVLKMGESGCSVKTAEGESFFAPAFPIEAVDTTGAGDAFCAGWVEGCLGRVETASKGKKTKGTKIGKGRSNVKGKGGAKGVTEGKDILAHLGVPELKKVAMMANAIGGIAASTMGVPSRCPSMQDLLSFIKKGKKDLVLE
jgi:sugar/nucleoside kinase (ribokinase family)